jgi:hypothetical protein
MSLEQIYNLIKLLLVIISIFHILFAWLLFLQIRRYNKVVNFHNNKLVSSMPIVYLLIVLLSGIVIILI